MRFVKPLDEEILQEVGEHFHSIITVEDGCIMGGFGSAVLEFLNDNGYKTQVIRLGIPDRFIEHGEPSELYEECGFSAQAIENTLKKILVEKQNVTYSGIQSI
jgi:1-deoxy-D-xylulose-5-phosphate synthase